MSSPFIGEIRIVAFDFAPRGWARCDGQTLAIAQNQALFSLLGTTYGGDGVTTFQLPDLRSRHAVGEGSGSASSYALGERTGTETVTLVANEMPAHTHQARAHQGSASDAAGPGGAVWGVSTTAIYATSIPTEPLTGATVGLLAFDALGSAGGSQPHPNQPPFLVLNYIIALVGIFPSRN